MQHKLKLKIVLTKSAKVPFFTLSAWLLKIMSKGSKLIKPCKAREVGRIKDGASVIEAELFFTFTNANVYIKNRDKIISSLQNFVNTIKLHTKVSGFAIYGYHESSEDCDFEIGSCGDVKTSTIQAAVLPLFAKYYMSISGKILSWDISDNKIKIKNKDFGNIIVKYSKNKAVSDLIIKLCGSKADINVVGSFVPNSAPQMTAIAMQSSEENTINDIKIPQTKHQSINIFELCQK